MSEAQPEGLPGGIATPAAFFVLCAVVFVYSFTHPGSIDLGPNVNPSGVAVSLGAAAFLWLLVAIAKRPPPPR